MRRILGGFGLLGAFAIGSEGEPLIQFVAAIIGIGAIIAIFTKNPEIALATGTCDKCLESDKLLAWNCQTGGCWAHICSDCQSVGDDPVEVYARTLGKVAVGAVIVGVGLGVVIATKGSAGGEMMELAGGIMLGDDEENSMLLCKECKDKLAAKKSENDTSKNTSKKVDFENTKKQDFLLENFTLNDGYCNHVDSVTDKKCKRISFRKGSYCYVHKDSY